MRRASVRCAAAPGRLDRLRKAAYAMRSVLVTALVLGLVVALLYSQATITELSGEIESARQELVAEQSTYDYLSGQMDKITSTNNIAAIAEGRLGLVKADPSQITYLDLEDEGLIVAAKAAFPSCCPASRPRRSA